jgi:ATP-dependent helicase HrpB
VLDRVHALEHFEESQRADTDVGELNRSAAKHIFRTRDQLLRMVRSEGEARRDPRPPQNPDAAFLRSLLAAYPDRLARAREPGSRRGLMVGGRGVRLADEVALADEDLFLCIDIDAGAGEALVRQASAVEKAWLPPEWLETRDCLEFDPAAERVISRRQVVYDDLVLEESHSASPSPEQIAEILVTAAETRLDRVFPGDDEAVVGFRRRVAFLSQTMPDLKLPRLGDDDLGGLLPQLAANCRSFADIRRAPWLATMKDLFSWQQLQTIEREAPERIEVPSGSHISVQYEEGRPPILAVRIQEVFGMKETPRVAGGRVPVLMHLLAPNMRVAQITDDLASFWANTYSMVRKDLRARYPKHSWPEDPYTAEPQKRPRRK